VTSDIGARQAVLPLITPFFGHTTPKTACISMQALSLDYAIANSSGQGGLGHAG